MKKRIFLLLVSVFMFLPVVANANELEKSFEISVDDNVSNIILSYDDSGKMDGHIIDLGSYNYLKIGLDNKVIWSKIDDKVVDFIVSVDSGNLKVKRVDLNNNNEVLWEEELGGSGEESVIGYLNDYDEDGEMSGYLLIFNTESTDWRLNPGYYIRKYDLDGNVLWTKKHEMFWNTTNGFKKYAQVDSGDWYSYYSHYTGRGSFSSVIQNISKNELVTGLGGSFSWVPVYILSYEKNKSFIIFLREGNNIKMHKYTLTGEEISTVDLSVSSLNWFHAIINSRDSLGSYDGLIVLSYNGDLGNSLLKFDYDGKLLETYDLSYTPTDIQENYDEYGNFNGYIVTDGSYVTKFTYPKKDIKSDNSDVVIDGYSYPGRTVKATVLEKSGYIVKRVIVRDSLGNEIEINDDMEFVMPDDDVSIEVVYEKREIVINPETYSAIRFVLFIIFSIVLGTLVIRNKKKVM